ncbi:MAG: NAD-dependent epimerase/dehydratase family protein, partial [Planctomycetota bacterium]
MSGTILLTGATGFLGSRIARELHDRGEHLHVTARAGSDRSVLSGFDRLTWHDADLGQPETLERAVHAAAEDAT